MLHDGYNYRLTLLSSAKEVLGAFAVQAVDWEPAKEAAWLQALRQGRFTGAEARWHTVIEPVWHERLGEPYVGRLQVAVSVEGAEPAATVHLPVSYFQAQARQAAAILAEQKRRQAGDNYAYLVTAHRCAPAADPTPAGVQPAGLPAGSLDHACCVPLILPRASLAQAAAGAVSVGPWSADDFRVLVPQQVLEEAGALAQGAGSRETGSVLLGNLQRDTRSPDIFLTVTAQVPAADTVASETKLTFTARTWAVARAALRQRGQGELMVGWCHSHPQAHWGVSCPSECPPERRAECPLGGGSFFSDEDLLLHRAVFSRAFCVALLVTVTASGLRYALFGWRHGAVVPRGFDLLPGADPSAFLSMNQSPAFVGKSCDETCCHS